MKFTYKLNIILGSLLIVSLISIFLLIFFQIRYNKKIIKDNDKILIEYEVKEDNYIKKIEDRNKQIEELNKTEPKTEKEIIYKNIVKKDTKLLNNCQEQKEILKDQLEKTNEILKRQNRKKNNIKAFTLGGIDTELESDVYVGVMYDRTIYSGKLIDINIGAGAAVKVYVNYGGAATLQLSISF